MRKCPACGYLLFGDGETCKHCGADLDGARSVPAPPFPGVPPAPIWEPHAPSAVAAPVVPLRSEDWGGLSGSARRAVGRRPVGPSRALLACVCVASMAFGWTAFNHRFGQDPLPSGTGPFVHGDGLVFVSPDHTFEARFPDAPTVLQRMIPVASTSATLDLAQVATDDYGVVAASIVLPTAVPDGEVHTVLHDIVRFGAVEQGAKIVSENQISQDGVPGIEANVSVPGGYNARLMVLMSGTRFYMLAVHSKHATKRLFDALVSSLIMF
jgi:hypothetical protein